MELKEKKKMIINRLKRNETTHSTHTTTGEEIKEGDVLGHGDNNPCVVLYNKWETKFEAIEFGCQNDLTGNDFTAHDLMYDNPYSDPWEMLGNVDDVNSKYNLLKEVPEDFDFNKHLEENYEN